MNKIVLLENTAVLKHRIENIINSSGHNQVDTYDFESFELKKDDVIFRDAQLVIVDTDSFKVDFDGFMGRLRAGQSRHNLPVVLVSSHVDKALVLQAARYGRVELLVKPFTDTNLLEKTLWNGPTPTLEKVQATKKIVKDQVKWSWSDEFKVGIKEIDDEHKMIVDHFEKLYTLMSEGKGHQYFEELLEFLEFYIDTHFSHEEDFHAKIQYDLIQEHKALHLTFTDKIRSIIKDKKTHTVTNTDLIHMNIFIKQWLMHHILVEDKKVANFVEDKL